MTDIYDHIDCHRVTDYAICEAHIVSTVKDLLSKEEQDCIIIREEEVEDYVGGADRLKEEEMDPPPQIAQKTIIHGVETLSSMRSSPTRTPTLSYGCCSAMKAQTLQN